MNNCYKSIWRNPNLTSTQYIHIGWTSKQSTLISSVDHCSSGLSHNQLIYLIKEPCNTLWAQVYAHACGRDKIRNKSLLLRSKLPLSLRFNYLVRTCSKRTVISHILLTKLRGLTAFLIRKIVKIKLTFQSNCAQKRGFRHRSASRWGTDNFRWADALLTHQNAASPHSLCAPFGSL